MESGAELLLAGPGDDNSIVENEEGRDGTTGAEASGMICIRKGGKVVAIFGREVFSLAFTPEGT